MQLEMVFDPQVTINGRTYRARNFRLIGMGQKWADVDYWHDQRGWRTVQNWDRIQVIAKTLWGQQL